MTTEQLWHTLQTGPNAVMLSWTFRNMTYFLDRKSKTAGNSVNNESSSHTKWWLAKFISEIMNMHEANT